MDERQDFGRPKFWRDKAKEARAIGEKMRDLVAKRTMLAVADHYDKMADQAARRDAEPK